MSSILQIQKIDPNFDLTVFAATLRLNIVPNVLEAYLRSDVEILENWCQERVSVSWQWAENWRVFTDVYFIFGASFECPKAAKRSK